MDGNWRWIVGCKDAHAISDRGEVYSVADACLLETSPGSHGYPQVYLCGRTQLVHTMMLEAFVGPRPPGALGLHKDDDRLHNMLGNLYWGTRSQNSLDAVRNGRHPMSRKAKCPKGHRYTPENTYQTERGRWCRQCHRDSNREYARRQRKARKAAR